MTESIEALFDGKVFRPEKPVKLKANTGVKIIVETVSGAEAKKVPFLRTAKALNLDGPPDWSANIDLKFRSSKWVKPLPLPTSLILQPHSKFV